MKITHMQGDAAVARLLVEGWVTQQTVQELSASCETVLTNHQTLLIDLSGVQFVDAAGVEVFRNLVPRGATLIGCSGFLTELLQVNAEGEKVAPASAQADEHIGEAQLIGGKNPPPSGTTSSYNPAHRSQERTNGVTCVTC